MRTQNANRWNSMETLDYKKLKLNLSESATESNSSLSWSQHGSIYVKGYIYSENSILVATDLAALFSNVSSLSDFERILKEVNGYFSIIIDAEDSIYAGVDRITSTPLHYKEEPIFEVGDDYRKFIDENSEISELSAMEYLASGYVHGEKTLLKQVKQLSAGSALRFDKAKGKIELVQYFRYIQNNNKSAFCEKEAINKLHQIHQKIFKRMVDSIAGRQAIVPLSGGYDSRLIVEMLALYGHKNTVCVTWGAGDYWQVKIAEQVASYFGFAWVRVDSSIQDWADWYQSEEFERQMELCGALASIPYVQDNLIFSQLKAKGILQDDAIFISGNSGDFIEGSHIIELQNDQDENSLQSLLVNKHMRLARLKRPALAETSLNKDLISFSKEFDTLEGFDEFWEWKERQSKFVSNCVKPFEAMGFEWRMPFWDLELMEFWSSIPRSRKSNRRLFYSYSRDFMNTEVPHANPQIGLFRRYSDALQDGRFGFYGRANSPLLNMLQRTRFARKANFNDLVRITSLSPVRFNGLLAMDALARVAQSCEIIRES